jgi:hypothetical protein
VANGNEAVTVTSPRRSLPAARGVRWPSADAGR